MARSPRRGAQSPRPAVRSPRPVRLSMASWMGRILLGVIAAAILALSLSPRPFPVPQNPLLSDKVEHAASYMVLGAVAALSLRRKNAAGLLLVLGACSAYGGVIEIVQPLVGRTRDILDFTADVLGSACGAAPVLLGAAARRALMARRRRLRSAQPKTPPTL